MKKTLLTMTLGLAAGVAIAATAPVAAILQPRLLPMETESSGASVATPDMPDNVLRKLSSRELLNERELHMLARASKLFQLDSIVGSLNKGEDKYTLQKFEYDENDYPVLRTNAYWNAESESWDPEEWYEFSWDEDGYCLVQMQYSRYGGQRYDFEYNDRKLGIVQIYSTFDGNDWTNIQRGDYEYDEAGNINQEIISAWDDNAEEWIPVVMNKAVWDAQGRQIDLEPYVWDGSGWTGSPDAEKKTHVYEEAGNCTMIGAWIWDESISDWFWYFRHEFDFNEKGLLTRSEKQFYNKTLQNWDGCELYYGVNQRNIKTLITYDDMWRLLDDVTYTSEDPGVYTMSARVEYDWTDYEDGASKCVRTSDIKRNDEWYVGDVTTTDYDAAGRETLVESLHVNMSTMELVNYQKNEYGYDEAGNKTFEKLWSSRGEGWIPGSYSSYEYDADNRVVEQISRRGVRDAGEDDWENNNRFTWVYGQDDIITEKLAYRWVDEDWAPNWGNGDFYDFSVSVADLVLWPGANFLYKLEETRSYNGYGDEWDYMASVYYYSDIDTSVEKVADNGLTLRYTDRMVIVDGDGDYTVRVYDAGGRCVIESAASRIDLSGLQSGMYVVTAGTSTLKVIL